MARAKIAMKMLAALPVLTAIHVFYLVTRTMIKIDARLDEIGDRLIAWAERIA